MNKFLTLTSSSVLLLGTLLITGCGSSGGGDDGGTSDVTYSGNTSPAAIDATNVEAIGTAAGESVEKAVSIGLPGVTGVVIDNTIDMDVINNIVQTIVSRASLPAGVEEDFSELFCTSGTVIGSYPGDPQSGPVDVTITFTNCAVIGAPLTFDGVAIWHFNDINNLEAGFSINYKNFKVTDEKGQTTTINMNMVCTSTGCTYNSDFVGSDGITHRVTDYNIYGDKTSGFYGDATFYHGTYGKVFIYVNGITYGSCGFLPDGGTIEFNSSDGSFGVITFHDDCTVSGNWTDSLGNSDTF